MEEIYGRPIAIKRYKYYIDKKEYKYHVDDTNILLTNEFMNIEHDRVRFILENKNECYNIFRR